MSAAGFQLEGERTPLRELIADLWASRPLIAILARKDFYVRYRRAAFGLTWAVGLPLLQAVIIAVVFSRVVHIHVGTSFAVFVLAGMVGWSYFSTTLATAATSIVDGSTMSTRVYFPRAVLPLVQVVANLYGFAIAVVVLLVLAPLLGVGLGARTLLLLPATVVLVVLTSGVCLVAAALHVYFRDVRYLVTAATLGWFYLTPVFYPRRLASGVLGWVVDINPLTGVVELFRAATGGADPHWAALVTVSLGWSVALVGLAAVLHTRYNRVFSDLL
ncbi:MAG TPA: ABC transporter permease [Acidimicrobiales bacterium]|nr:ABC transporter permease [Acidimicrobiales bacterium]